MNNICIFFGHRDAPSRLYPALLSAVEQHVTKYGVTDFRVGNHGDFDSMAAKAVCEVKKAFPNVQLSLMLAYLPSDKSSLPGADRFDRIIYPEGMETVMPRFAISKLNRIMVQDADYAISYVVSSWGGAAKTYEMAKRRKNLKITNLE